jgi:hypothetical protein
MAAKGPDNESAPQNRFLALFEKVMEFWESTERVLSVLAGLFLAVVFWLRTANTVSRPATNVNSQAFVASSVGDSSIPRCCCVGKPRPTPRRPAAAPPLPVPVS